MCMSCHSPRVYDNEPPAVAATPAVTSTARTCPQCGYRLGDDFQFCPKCSLRLHSPANCAYCGHTLEPDWKTCPSCGAAVGAK